MLATDPYGNFEPGPHGLPQYVTDNGLVEGDNTTVDANGKVQGVPVPANVKYFDTPFLADIAHNAEPTADTDHNPATAPVLLRPDDDNVASADFAHQPPGTYDDEMLNAHFCAGDGRVNENIALTTIHQIFHSEHDRLVDYIDNIIQTDSGVTAADKAYWTGAAGPMHWNYGQKLFQAARFITEMEYQHLVFEEFARKVVPAIRPFHLYQTEINPTIPAEFAHAVYRFGHSMLDDTVARQNEDPNTGLKTDNSLPLLTAFLNPPEYFDSDVHNPNAPRYTPRRSPVVRRHAAMQLDASLLKRTRINERLSFQIGFEAFNLMNHNYFGRDQYNTDPTSAQFGSIRPSTVSTQNILPRQIQVRFKFNW